MIIPFGMFRGGPTDISPSDLANLMLWNDGETNITPNGPDVSDIGDQSEQGVDFFQTVPANQPFLAVANQNGLDGITFDGATEFMTAGDVAAFDGMGSFTCSLLMKPTAVGAGFFTIFGKWRTSGNLKSFAVSRSGDEVIIFISGDGSTTTSGLTSSTALAAGTPVLISTVFDGAGVANADRLKVFINGGPEETLTFSGTIPSSNFATNQELMLGAHDSVLPTNHSNMTFYELCMYSDVKSNSDRALLENYLINRWIP